MTTTPNSLILPQTPNAGAFNCVLSTAMTAAKAFDGTEAVGTSMALVHTVGADGGQLPPMRIKYTGTNGNAPSGATTASTLRIFFNAGGAAVNTTAANNTYFADVPLPTVTIGTVQALQDIYYDFRKLMLPAGTRIYAGLVTAIGGTNCAVVPSMFGGGNL